MNGIQNQWRPSSGEPTGNTQQEQQQPYPANKEEVQQFIADIMNGLYSEGQVEKVSQAMKSSGQAIGVIIGSIAGSLVISIIARRKKENGRVPRKKLLERGVQKAISELIEIGQASGVQGIDENTVNVAADTAVQLIRKQFSGQQQGQPQPGQQPPQQPGQPPVQQQPQQQPMPTQGQQPMVR